VLLHGNGAMIADMEISGLTLRPHQMRASSEETMLMVPAAAGLEGRYHGLRLPVCIMAGGDDRIVDPEHQSLRLHAMIEQSELRVLPGLGHMIHYFATDQVVRAIDSFPRRRTRMRWRLAEETVPSNRSLLPFLAVLGGRCTLTSATVGQRVISRVPTAQAACVGGRGR
jgi:hypothetical protein